MNVSTSITMTVLCPEILFVFLLMLNAVGKKSNQKPSTELLVTCFTISSTTSK